MSAVKTYDIRLVVVATISLDDGRNEIAPDDMDTLEGNVNMLRHKIGAHVTLASTTARKPNVGQSAGHLDGASQP